jgi:uncharacterized protein (DUF849 family)
MSIRDRLIINAALTGMVPTKADNPHVPISPEEIAADARRCVEAGAAIVHLHARDREGRATVDPQVYGEVLRRVREACPEVILCVSTSGRVHKTFEERSAVLDVTNPAPPPALPEMASLTLGSLNFPAEASVNAPEMIERLALKMRARGVVPELEVFEIGMAEYTQYLIKHGVLQRPYYANILLGNRGTLGATEGNLRVAVAALPRETTWAGAGIGRFQLAVNRMAIELGGHVRVGLEDNLWFDEERTVPAGNARLVERVAGIGRAAGRVPASPAEARAIIGLPEVPASGRAAW